MLLSGKTILDAGCWLLVGGSRGAVWLARGRLASAFGFWLVADGSACARNPSTAPSKPGKRRGMHLRVRNSVLFSSTRQAPARAGNARDRDLAYVRLTFTLNFEPMHHHWLIGTMGLIVAHGRPREAF